MPAPPAAGTPTTAFTYQGQLNDTGAAATGSYDISFADDDAPANGNLIGNIVTNLAVGVSNGLFTTSVDFGDGVFTGQGLWLEIAVSTNGANAFSIIAPRQQFTPTPYALYAQTAGTSASAPLWAGFTALVNQQNAEEGKNALGFANPAIYDLGESSVYNVGFHDITSGSNTNSVSPKLYFAQNGYDLCTGWGSPTGQSLINLLVGLSGSIFVDLNYTGSVQDGNFTMPFKTLASGVNAVSDAGTIYFKTAGHTPETTAISKPMTITSVDGPVIVGQ